MAIGDFFSARPWEETSWETQAACRGLSNIFFQQPPNDLKHVSDASLKLEMFVFRVQFLMTADHLRDATASTDSGVENQKKNVTVPGID